MGWIKLKDSDIKESHIRKLMELYRSYDELFEGENFRFFSDDLKRKLEKSLKADVQEEMSLCERHNVRIIDANNECYPDKLKEVTDYPLFLYIKGKGSLKREEVKAFGNDRKDIGVVGTRRVTKFGKSACEKLVKDLLEYDVTIISGLAEGIDTVALATALGKNGRTVAVVGSGLDVVYPYENRTLWEKISETGLLISEHPLGTKPLKWNFPRRNRIIAGLSDGVLIAESFKSGGAIITAELAFSLDREVFAIPGFINYPSFEGCNNLIKDNKARLVTCGEDIAKEFLWDLKREGSKIAGLSHEEKIVFSQLNEEIGLEELIKKVNDLYSVRADDNSVNNTDIIRTRERDNLRMTVDELLSILMYLKIKGLITETGTAKYMRSV